MNSLPITSRDDASGSTRENTLLKKYWSSPMPVSIAYVPCSRVTNWAIDPSSVGLTITHRLASPRTSSG